MGIKRSADENETKVKKVKFDKKPSEIKKIPANSNDKQINKKPGVKNNFKNGKVPENKYSKPFVKRENIKTENAEKVDWNVFKKQKKELKLKRKGGKDLSEEINKAKKIYENLKCKSTKNKDELCIELHSLICSPENYQKLVLAHDTARIVQCMLKHSPANIRRTISESLIPVIVQMATSKYAHFCVLRMIKYGTPDIKQKVIEASFGSIVKMVNYAHSSSIIDNIYISWASSQQKAYMRQELYGDLYKKSKDTSVKSIADTYRDSPHMKVAILNSIKSNLNRVVNKKLVDNSLIHDVLLDFLHECNEEDRNELIAAFSPYIPSLASTKKGVQASMICFWNSIVKDRRAIVKTLKEHLIKLCTHEHGHTLILAIVNSMDDTKALKKAIFDHIFKDIETIVSNEWGRKIIEWFVAPSDTTLFHPQLISFLEEGLKFSKKDKETRRAELLQAVEEPLCQAIAENPSFWLRGGHTGLATAAILKNCTDTNIKLAFDGLADVICNTNWRVPAKETEEENSENTHIKIEKPDETDENASKNATKKKIKKKKVFVSDTEIKTEVSEDVKFVLGVEHAGLHIVLKKILKLGKDNDDAIKFSTSLVEKLTDEVVQQWLSLNRASFLLINAYENATADVQKKIKEFILNNINILKQQKHTASKILRKSLKINN